MKSKSGKITRPEPSVEVGPVNNVLSSLFESMQMQINDRQIEPKVTRSAKRANIPDGDYPYRCYLNTLLYPSVTRLDSIANGLGIKQNGSSHDAVKDVDVPGTQVGFHCQRSRNQTKRFKSRRRHSIANGLGIKQNSSTISWDFKHNILWRDLQVLDGHQKMDKTWKDAFPKS